LDGIIEIPNKLKNRLVEIILLPVNNENHNTQGKDKSEFNRLTGLKNEDWE